MKKKLLKFIARMLALLMLAGCFGVSVGAAETPSFDTDKDSSLTIKTTRTNRTFDLYQIFYGNYTRTTSGVQTLTDIQWGVSIVGTSVRGSNYDYTDDYVTKGSYDLSKEIIKWLKKENLPDEDADSSTDNAVDNVTDNGTKNPLYECFKDVPDTITAAEIAEMLARASEGSLTNSSENAEAFARICGYVIDSHTYRDSKNTDFKTPAELAAKGKTYYYIEKREVTPDDYSGNGYVCQNLHDGYYMICDVSSDIWNLKDQMRSRYILQVAGPAFAEIKLESEPTLDKKILQADGSLVEFDNAAIGDEITFQVTGKVPDMSDFNEFYYIVYDYMCEGLTFEGIESITVGDLVLTVSENALDRGQTYCINVTEDEDDGTTTIEIVFNNMKQYAALKEESIVIKYKAVLNENCYVGNESKNYNRANLNFSNDPKHIYKGKNRPASEDEEYMGYTPLSTVYVYTTGIRIEKVDPTGFPLTGAKFKIEGESLNKLVERRQEYVAEGYGILLSSENKVYYKLTDGTYTDEAPVNSQEYAAATTEEDAEGTTVPLREFVRYSIDKKGSYVKDLDGEYYKELETGNYVSADSTEAVKGVHETDVVYYSLETVTEIFEEEPTDDVNYCLEVGEDGVLELDGLKAGIYTITEVVAPDGYDKLDNSITIKIDWDSTVVTSYVKNQLQDECTWEFFVDTSGGTAFKSQASDLDGIYSMRVENRTDATLPQTGGVGTVLCYVIGSILVITSSALLTIRFRRAYLEKNGGESKLP